MRDTLAPMLQAQLVMHLLILLSYGSLTALGIVWCAGAAADGHGEGVLPGLALALAGVGLLVSAFYAVRRAIKRLQKRPFGQRDPSPTFELFHYCAGAVLCLVLSLVHWAFIPALLFSIYSVVCMVRAQSEWQRKEEALRFESRVLAGSL